MSTNPWVKSEVGEAPPPEDEICAPASALPAPTLLTPQLGLVPPRRGDGLSTRRVGPEEALASTWWVGAHGGAGESTLEQLMGGSRAAGHAWPLSIAGAPPQRVVLVARTNASGLKAAQLAATEWASGAIRVRLDGLVLISDAPGRLPRPLKDFAQLIAGGVPAVWRVPWVEAWRLGEPVTAESAPRDVARMTADLNAMPDTHLP